jgi:tripartite-type tricarboxylate transporter receptor subunit TctC
MLRLFAKRLRGTSLGIVLLLGFGVGSGRADDVQSFYSGRTINVVIGTSAGGGYDLYARVLAKYLGRHIPGNPTVVPQNMPGAGTLRAMMYLYAVAPKDGTVIGTFSRSMPLAPVLGLPGANFDGTKLTWLGSITKDTVTCISWKNSPVKTWDDTFKTEYKAGGEGKGADPDVYATILKNAFATKTKLVTGYPGSADIMLAMERGELDGLCGVSYSTLRSTHANWLADKSINILNQGALEPDPALPGVPSLMDLAKTDEQKEMLKLILAPQAMARPFAAPPGVPADRAKALQTAFDDTVKDPDFVAEAGKLGLDVNPMTGDQVEALLKTLYATPKNISQQAVAVSGY